MIAYAIDDKGTLYAEIDLSRGDRTAIPAGYSLVAEDMWGRVKIVAKTATDGATIAALSLIDARVATIDDKVIAK